MSSADLLHNNVLRLQHTPKSDHLEHIAVLSRGIRDTMILQGLNLVKTKSFNNCNMKYSVLSLTFLKYCNIPSFVLKSVGPWSGLQTIN